MTHAILASPLACLASERCWLICNANKAPCDRHGVPLAGWQHKGATLEQALRFVDMKRVAGVGLNLSRFPIVAIDLDAMVDGAGVLTNPVASRILADAPTYVERSWSGRGLHAFYTLLGEHEPINKTWTFSTKPHGGKQPQISIFYRAPRFIVTTADVWSNHNMPVTIIEAGVLRDWVRLLNETKPQPRGTASESQVGRGRLTQKQVEGILRRVAEQCEGSRNNYTFWAACRLRDGGVSMREALHVLEPVTLAIGLPMREVHATITSAYSRGGDHVR